MNFMSLRLSKLMLFLYLEGLGLNLEIGENEHLKRTFESAYLFLSFRPGG